MSDKLEKLKQLMELMKSDTITPKEVEKFLTFVVELVKRSRADMEVLSSAHIKDMKKMIVYLEGQHEKLLGEVKETSEGHRDLFEEKISELKKLMDKVSKMKPIKGKDGKDADQDVIVDVVLSKIKLPEFKETVLDSGEEIVAKINDLSIDNPEFLIDAKHIKNLPKPGQMTAGGARFIQQLFDVKITDLTSGDLLQWDGTNWINSAFDNNGILSLNGLTGGTQTFAVGTTGTDFGISSSGTVHTFNLPTASASNRGALSSADWTAFNAKASTLASVSALSTDAAKSTYTMTSTIPVEFRSSDGNSLLYLNETSEYIRVGVSALTEKFSISGANNDTFGILRVHSTGGALPNSGISLTTDIAGSSNRNWQIVTNYATAGTFEILRSTSNGGSPTTNVLTILNTGVIGIGTGSTVSAKLHVISTTEQLRLGYDASNRVSFTVNSAGALNISPTGAGVGIGTTTPTALFQVTQNSTGNGTVATNGTTTLTGTNTLFTKYFRVGDTINVSGETTRVISSITSDTVLVTTVAFSTTASSLTYTISPLSPANKLNQFANGNLVLGTIDSTTTTALSNVSGAITMFTLTGTQSGSASQYAQFRFSNTGNNSGSIGTYYANAANAFSIVAGGVTAITALGSGNVGIGVSPNHRLDTYLSSSSTGVSTIYGLRDIPSGTISSGSSINGVFGQVTVSGSSTISNVIPTAGRFIAEHDGSSTVGGLYGVYAHARTNAASTGVLANAYSIYAVAPNNNQAGNTITNAYSLYIESPTAGATLNYGLYQTGSANNYFGGSVGIGAATPSAKLHTISTTEQYRNGYDTNNYMSVTTGSAGITTFNLVGTSPYYNFNTGILRGDALHNNALAQGSATQQDIRSGTYTPTLTGVLNVAASTAYPAQWMRVGNVVTVSGSLDVDPTAAGATQLGVSLPVASNFAFSVSCAGGMGSNNVADAGTVIGDATNDRAQINWIAVDTANRNRSYWFTYEVI